MSNSTKRELLDASSFGTSAEESQDKEASSKLMEREPVENTPFFIMGNNVDGFFLVMGKYRLSGVFDTKEEVIVYMNTNMYDILANMIGVFFETYKDVLRSQE